MRVLAWLCDRSAMGQRSGTATSLLLLWMMSVVVTSTAALRPQASEAGSSFLPGAPVTQLEVKAEVLYRSVQLRVSWKPPTNASLLEEHSLPTGYVVHISLSSSHDPYCTKDTKLLYQVHVADPTNSSVLLPPLRTLQQGTKMAIRQECSYLVKVESDPVGSSDAINTTYTVPKCVDMLCRCPENISMPSSLSKELLPNGDMNVSWVLDDLSIARVKLRKKLILSKINPPLKPFVWWKEVNASSVIIPSKDLEPDLTYLLEVETVESSNCHGDAVNITFIAPRSKDKNEAHSGSKLVLIAVLLVLLLILALGCITAIMMGKLCKVWTGRLQPIHKWQSIYKTVSMESRLSRVMQERNVLYVEKEIEEAKIRGEVDKFEVSYSRIQLGRQIGRGAFGLVFLARAQAIAGIPGCITVAVKKLKQRASPEEVEEFLLEIAMLKRVGRHPNIVTLLGCCTLQEPYCMLMEYVPCGDLLRYLRRLRDEYQRCLPRISPRYVDLQLSSTSDSEGSYVQPDAQCTQSSGRPSIAETECTLLSWDAGGQKLECVLDSQELHKFALQIARGMAHLEEKRITHRDLAARNVLIDEHRTLKISDFGLSRTGIYVNTRRNKVPLRWLSVEAMQEHLYSNKSDVWAFGIVLWEIGTLGGFPYPTVEDMKLLTFLLNGSRLEKPDNCSDELYNVMLKCWTHCPNDRPTFAELVTGLQSLVNHNRAYVDFRYLPSPYVLPPPQHLPEVESQK